ncbi:transglutaminase-like domain-containing protein [Bacillus sp. FJAT-29790]|uniref:transglutaminase domain-containing protein n=1 Tax=Bacillus sp. FJAT-29790 TaxID=1895002 RepID=UPI001C219E78|nr:transglutaminase-like domain-containing protein [Bacillus sp. FJAT-29790]MBU8881376.1 transglutaminase-like domain-containing protein [Bacillus sp. FJAT-29790]
MNRKSPLFTILICLYSSILFLSACSNASSGNSKTTTSIKEDKYEKQVKELNKELELEPIELTSYSEKIGVILKEPEHKKFAVNGEVIVEGEIGEYSQLKSDYAWIKVHANEEGPAGDQLEYYTPINDGKFRQVIHFFNGEGEYSVKVRLPSTDRENYYYDIVDFEVVNVNPEYQRDVTYTTFGKSADLSLKMKSSYMKKDGIFPLKGKVGNLTDDDTIMIKLNKDGETWSNLIPIKNGKFEYDIPLFFGKGLHKLEVLVPDEEREKYYQTATTILIENESNRKMLPIEYTNAYIERGVTLEYPIFGGEDSNGTFNIKGTIDPKAEFASETTHIYITTKKGEDEALDVIPVKDFIFNDSFYLRFGPGTYEVIVSVPEITDENSDHFSYFSFAKFEVESIADKDQRDILPSRGVQSDAPKIKGLAKDLTSGKNADLEKAKAIYDYVAQNIAYDVGKFENNEFEWDDSALKTLELKSGVCQDYAFLTIALLRASDIEAKYVEGRAGRGWFPGRHAWVEAKIDGRWLTMDPTWGSGYVNDNQFVAKFNEDYFDPNMDEFNKTHTRTGVSY